MEINQDRKSGVESQRWLTDNIPATSAAKLVVIVMLCIPLDFVSTAETGAIWSGQCTTSIYHYPGLHPGEVIPVSQKTAFYRL